MKKIVVILFFIVFIFNINFVHAHDYYLLPDVIYGDVDGNGNVNVKDYLLIRKMLLSLIDKTDNADINNDGEITAQDYLIIQKIIMGIITIPNTPSPTSNSTKADTINIMFKSVDYTGNGIEATAFSTSGIGVNLTYYSDINCSIKTNTSNAISDGGPPKAVGTYYAIGMTSGNMEYEKATSSCIKAIEINHIEFKLDRFIGSVKEGGTLSLSPSPSDINVTYSSNNSKVATVSSDGIVTGKMAGSVKIIAKSPSGYENEVSIIVLAKNPSQEPITYNGGTLKYWIQYYNIKASNNRYKKYTLTNVWMKDAYNQMKVAHPLKYIKSINIINNEISTYGYQNKGILAMNASPSSDNGYPSIPLVIDTGKDGKTKVLKNTGKSSGYSTYGLGKDGILRSYVTNSKTKDKVLADGVKYTFGFRPTIINNYKYDSNSVAKAASGNLPDLPDVRSAVCQVDKNNFIIITSVGFSLETSDRRKYGLSLSELGDMMLDLKCITGINLDGGSSLTYMYKKNTGDFKYIRQSAKPGRSDLLYFVE